MKRRGTKVLFTLLLGVLTLLSACATDGSPAASALAVASADPSPTGTPSTTSTSEPTMPARSSPSAGASAPSDATRPIFQNWALATVRVNGLNVRAGPGISQPLVPDDSGQFDAGGVVRLQAGDHVMVMSDAQAADGGWWVQIGVNRNRVGPSNPIMVGWAMAGTSDDPWVDADNTWCPGAAPSLDALLSLSGIERMGCYGAAPLTFEAHQATIRPDAGLGGVCPPVEPRWLLCDHINYNWVNRDGAYDWEFLLHFDPATSVPATGLANEGESRNLTVTGHFMDSAATACAPNPLVTNEDVARYLSCSTLFVVEGID